MRFSEQSAKKNLCNALRNWKPHITFSGPKRVWINSCYSPFKSNINACTCTLFYFSKPTCQLTVLWSISIYSTGLSMVYLSKYLLVVSVTCVVFTPFTSIRIHPLPPPSHTSVLLQSLEYIEWRLGFCWKHFGSMGKTLKIQPQEIFGLLFWRELVYDFTRPFN